MAAAPKKLTLADVLLPTDVTPSRYEIFLEPDLVACTFAGKEVIEVEVHKATREVTLHANKLTVHADVSFASSISGGAKPKLTGFAYDIASETVKFTFDQDLPVGPGKLSLSFSGVLNDDLAGFYRSKYKLRGEDRWMAVTQFEATDARRCFPCWDEPALKAVFAVTITAPADRVVLSNSAVARVDTSACGKKKTYTFQDTPRQSTYLVAFFIGDFDVVSATGPKDGILTSIYVPVGKAALGGFALKCAVDGIQYLAELFGIEYLGGSKCDHIAIPDFAAGAMENTGAISYREALLLVDEKESSLATKQRVAQVISHELSHQCALMFGNRTTMKWWNGLWLNEGFAKHMEYVVTEHLYPEWDTFSHFTSLVQSAAFSLDAMATTHPIEVYVAHPDEVNEIFDLVSYNKGASVIRMMFDWLTRDVGFKGLHAYLTKFAYKNAVTEDLWESLTEVSGQPVGAVMRNWVVKPGYPYVAMSTAGGKRTLQSGRFIAPWSLQEDTWPTADSFASGPSLATVVELNKAVAASGPASIPAGADADMYKDGGKVGDRWNQDWCIPISVVTNGHAHSAAAGGAATGGAGTSAPTASPSGNGSTATKLGVLALDPASASAFPRGGSASREEKLAAMAAEIDTHVASNGCSWVKVNASHAAFFRTIYDAESVAKLHAAVATPADRSAQPALGVKDRLGLVGDVTAAVSIGATSSSVLLPLLWALRFDTDYNVWSAILDALSSVQGAAEGVGADVVAAVDKFTRALVAPICAHLGWEPRAGEEPNAPLLRARVIRVAALAGDETVVAEALKRFDAFAAGKGAIAADSKDTVYNTAAQYGGADRWNKLATLMAAATAAGNSEEQRRLMTALGRAANDATLLQKALDMVFDDSKIRSQDVPFLVGAVASNPGTLGRTLTWNMLTTRWDDLQKKFGAGNFLWTSVVGAACGYFDSKAAADEIKAFFATHPAGSAERKVQQSLEAIRSRAWRSTILKNDPERLVDTIAKLA